MIPLLIALQLLTRFPIRIKATISDQNIGHSLLYYPVAGTLIGVILSAVLLTLHSHTSSLLLAALILACWVIITGALHLDGLADSADAWLGGFGDRQRTLDIMKDPRCGPAAVVVLIIVLLLKLAALEYIITNQQWDTIFIACIFSRTMLLPLFLTTPYVRENGLGSIVANHLPRLPAWWITGGVLILLITLSGLTTMASIIVAIAIWLYIRHMMTSRIGGMTGDTAGATVEIMELVILVGACF